MLSIKRLDFTENTEFKLKNNKSIEYQFSLKKYSIILSDRDYSILKHYLDGTLKNISLSCKMIHYVNIFFEIDSNEKYFIELKPKSYNSTIVRIGDFVFTFKRSINNVIMNCKVGDKDYALEISEDKYEMFQDYKNGKLKDCIVSSYIEQDDVLVEITNNFYDFKNVYCLCLTIDKTSNMITEILKELENQK